MDENSVREKIRRYIILEELRNPSYPLSDGEPLYSDGLMDSFSLATFGNFVQDAFDVYIPDPDLTVIKMDTIDLMVARVMRG